MDSDTWIPQAGWTGVVDINRAPSPNPRPSKRAKQTAIYAEDEVVDINDVDQAWLQQELVTDNWIEENQDWLNNNGFDINGNDYGLWVDDFTQPYAETFSEQERWDLSHTLTPTGVLSSNKRKKMQTGCIPCL